MMSVKECLKRGVPNSGGADTFLGCGFACMFLRWDFCGVDMRKFGGVQSHLDSSGLVSFFLAKGKQVHRFTV